MKQLIITVLFSSVIICSLSQVNMTAKWPQNEIDTIPSYFKTIDMDMRMPDKLSSYDLQLNNLSEINITNVEVSRNPAQVLITNDNQFAYVRCFLSNTVEIIKITTGEVVKSFSIPSPTDLLVSKNGTDIIVASFRDEPIPPNPPSNDCSILGIGLSGLSLLTTINIPSQEIRRVDTIKTLVIKRLLKSSEDNIIYLQGREVIEYDLSSKTILRYWPISQQIWLSKIDNKNKKIFLTTIDTTGRYLKVIDLLTGNILTSQYYTNGEIAGAFYIGMDTLSNRIFIQGKLQPNSEVLVFDGNSLNQLPPIVGAYLGRDSFITCPALGSIFIGAYPDNTLELDYLTLQPKQILPLPLYSHWHTLLLSKDNSKLFSFQYGASEDGLSFINPPQYLDVVEYDIETGYIRQYNTTEQKYGCSYTRTLATTNDGHYLIATNSPENTVSILEISHNRINELTSSNFITIFPNPADNWIVFKYNLPTNQNGYEILISGITGKPVYKVKVFGGQGEKALDTRNFKSGVYFYSFKSGLRILKRGKIIIFN